MHENCNHTNEHECNRSEMQFVIKDVLITLHTIGRLEEANQGGFVVLR